MNIFIGPHRICEHIPLFAKGFRSLGHRVTTGIRVNTSSLFHPSQTYDIILQNGDMNQVNQIIEEHDVFFFLYGISLLPENKDFEIIRKAGKKIISSFNGSDIRYWQALGQETGIDYTSYTEEEASIVFKPQRLYQILPTLRRGEIYADLVLHAPDYSGVALRPGRNGFCPIDLSKYQFHVPARDIPVVVHAPSNQAIKGTKFILKALDELQQEGVKFDLRLLQDVSNTQVLESLLDADCAIDQALLGASNGKFASEAMASGCAVASAHMPNVPEPAVSRPIQRIHIDTMKEDLRPLLLDKDLRIRLAHEGRTYVEKYHDYNLLCQEILEALEVGEKWSHLYQPSFYATKFLLPEGILIPQKLKHMGDVVVKRYGLPHAANLLDMVQRGLLSKSILNKPVPRWLDTPSNCENSKDSCKEEKSLVDSGTHSASCLRDILVAQGRYELIRLYPNFSNAGLVNEYMDTGEVSNALIVILDSIIEKTQDNTADNTAKQRDLSLSLGVAGFLFYTHAKEFMGFFTDETINLFSLVNITPEVLLKCFATLQIAPLISWLVAFYYLEKGDTAQAWPLFKKVLEGFPPPANISAALDSYSSECTYCISWDRPDVQEIQYFSPAALLPDWCIEAKKHVQWEVIMFICLAQGLRITIPQKLNIAEKYRNTLDSLLRNHGRSASSLESNA